MSPLTTQSLRPQPCLECGLPLTTPEDVERSMHEACILEAADDAAEDDES